MTGAFTDATRQAVRDRAGGRCELCGSRAEVGHFHHRRPRAMGGTSRDDAAAASNCLLLHPRCHAGIESSREKALRNGWIVSAFDSPLLIPAKLWYGLVLLSDDGSFSPALGNALA